MAVTSAEVTGSTGTWYPLAASWRTWRCRRLGMSWTLRLDHTMHRCTCPVGFWSPMSSTPPVSSSIVVARPWESQMGSLYFRVCHSQLPVVNCPVSFPLALNYQMTLSTTWGCYPSVLIGVRTHQSSERLSFRQIPTVDHLWPLRFVLSEIIDIFMQL